jgi:quinol monooxygenase YgiN
VERPTEEGSGVPADTHQGSGVITFMGTITIKPEHDEEFVALATATAEMMRRHEPHTILYLSYRHPTKAHTYAFVERYRNVDAWNTHIEAPYVREAMARLRDCAVEPPDTLQLTAVLFDVQRPHKA